MTGLQYLDLQVVRESIVVRNQYGSALDSSLLPISGQRAHSTNSSRVMTLYYLLDALLKPERTKLVTTEELGNLRQKQGLLLA
jgi:hypothetical protein